MLKTIIYIAIGGAIGSVLRYLTSVLVNKYWSNHFPLATFIANILGCFLVGLFIGILEKNNLANSNLKWFLITGFVVVTLLFQLLAMKLFPFSGQQFLVNFYVYWIKHSRWTVCRLVWTFRH